MLVFLDRTNAQRLPRGNLCCAAKLLAAGMSKTACAELEAQSEEGKPEIHGRFYGLLVDKLGNYRYYRIMIWISLGQLVIFPNPFDIFFPCYRTLAV